MLCGAFGWVATDWVEPKQRKCDEDEVSASYFLRVHVWDFNWLL